MAIEIKVPNLPESVSSATVATWHVKAGDAVSREQNLLDLETDKVMLEVPATADGVLKEIRVQAGATVQAGDILGILEEGAAPAAKQESKGEPARNESVATSSASTPAMSSERSDEHTSELQSLMRNSYAVFCLKKKKT